MQYLSLQCAAVRGEPLRHFQWVGLDMPRTMHAAG